MNSQVNATGHQAVRSRIRHQEFMIRCVKMQVYVRQALEGLAPQEPRVEPSCAYSFRLERGQENLVVNQHFSGKLVLHGTDGPLFRRAVEIVVHGYHRRYSKFNMRRSGYHLN